ncbi:hypothetical protein Bca101_010779 [Brassica carinata]
MSYLSDLNQGKTMESQTWRTDRERNRGSGEQRTESGDLQSKIAWQRDLLGKLDWTRLILRNIPGIGRNITRIVEGIGLKTIWRGRLQDIWETQEDMEIMEDMATPCRHLGGRHESRVEWQPVRRSNKMEVKNERSQVSDQETKEERIRKIKGKQIARDSPKKRDEYPQIRERIKIREFSGLRDTLIPDNQEKENDNNQRLNPEKRSGPQKESRSQEKLAEQAKKNQEAELVVDQCNAHLQEKQTDLEDSSPLNEEERQWINENYTHVDINMDEEMLDEDDLLGEELNEKTEGRKHRLYHQR